MLEDELRAAKAEIESERASLRAELVEREAEFEQKVRDDAGGVPAADHRHGDLLRGAAPAGGGRAGRPDRRGRDHRAPGRRRARDDARRMDAMRQDSRPRRARPRPGNSVCWRRTTRPSAPASRSGQLEAEIKERSGAVTQAHKEADDSAALPRGTASGPRAHRRRDRGDRGRARDRAGARRGGRGGREHRSDASVSRCRIESRSSIRHARGRGRRERGAEPPAPGLRVAPPARARRRRGPVPRSTTCSGSPRSASPARPRS